MKPISLHNICYSAQSDFSFRKVGGGQGRRTPSLLAPSDLAVKPLLRVLRRIFPFLCFTAREAVCLGAASSWPVAVVRFWRSSLNALPRVHCPTWELAIAPHRLCLRCVTCHRETAGWALTERVVRPGRVIPFGWSTKFAAKRLPG